MATVKAPGSRLSARPSLNKADVSAMATMRRQVSGQQYLPPPPLPTHTHEPLDVEVDSFQPDDASSVYSQNSLGKRGSSLVQLDLPSVQNDENLGLGLEQEFDRVVKAQKRGYLMRQNTKVVVASNRDDEEVVKPAPLQPSSLQPAPLQPSPRKPSQQAWVTEPWNGKSRRRSLRAAGEGTSTRKSMGLGQAPPLPGQASVVHDGLNAVNEDETAEDEVVDFDQNAERGCLFVKVLGVKDLDLPLAQDEQSSFALTLDNGLHCVTTSWLPLGRNAAIDQEFELVVLDDLEFQLTLQMKLEPPQPRAQESSAKPAPPSPTKKPGAFSRLFGSPKKHREPQISRPTSPVKPQPPTTYDMVQGLVGQDGSFARAYVALSEHEKHAFGRPYTVDIVCFNEWAMEEVPMTIGSSRSKKSVNTLQRRVPYHIGKLELLLLYIPKPKGTKDEDMPKSMNGALRELREAESKAKAVTTFEGHLSQQGGDCPYWRRRMFKLVGSKLTAYHETTNQPRATINLAKATRLVDDRGALTKKETSTKGGGRRKSAFAEEEEGYMFVEEGFRIRFANGEVIDFYADSAAAKAQWMKALSEVVGKSNPASSSKPWVDAIVKRSRSMAAKEGRSANSRKGVGPKKSTGSGESHQHQQRGQPSQQEYDPSTGQDQPPLPQREPQQRQQQQQQHQRQQRPPSPPLPAPPHAVSSSPENKQLEARSPSQYPSPRPTSHSSSNRPQFLEQRHSGIPLPTSPCSPPSSIPTGKSPALAPAHLAPRSRNQSPEKDFSRETRNLPATPASLNSGSASASVSAPAGTNAAASSASPGGVERRSGIGSSDSNNNMMGESRPDVGAALGIGIAVTSSETSSAAPAPDVPRSRPSPAPATAAAPAHSPRFGHVRADSYQHPSPSSHHSPTKKGGVVNSSSPMKGGKPTNSGGATTGTGTEGTTTTNTSASSRLEARYQKARSMIGMQWH